MIGISVIVQDREVRQLLKAAPSKINRAIMAWLTDVSRLVLRELTVYPPEPAGSRYVRTLTLERSWSVDPIKGAGLEASVFIGSSSNEAPYNRFVQDEERQASVHVGRWTNTVQGVAKRNQLTASTILNRRLKAAFG